MTSKTVLSEMRAEHQCRAVDEEAIFKERSRTNSNASHTENVGSFVASEVNNQLSPASEEQIKTLRHVSDRMPIAA